MFLPLICPDFGLPRTPTMASYDDYKAADGSFEKHDSQLSSVEPVEEGSTSGLKRRFGFGLAVDQEPSSFAATPNASNADFDPIPPSKRTWSMMAYVAYWMADAWAVSNWEVGMSLCVRLEDSDRDREGLTEHFCQPLP